MFMVAKRAAQKRLLQEFISKRAELLALQDQIRTLKAQIEPTERKLRQQFPQGVALDLGHGEAKIVEFVETERKTVDLKKVRAILGAKLPTNSVTVRSTQIYDGQIS